MMLVAPYPVEFRGLLMRRRILEGTRYDPSTTRKARLEVWGQTIAVGFQRRIRAILNVDREHTVAHQFQYKVLLSACPSGTE